MSYTNTSIATAIAGVIALGPGSMTISAQATVDLENRYSNVGAIMVWRVDDAGQACRAAWIRQRHTDSGSRDGDGRSLHRAGHGTRVTAAVDPNIRELQSN